MTTFTALIPKRQGSNALTRNAAIIDARNSYDVWELPESTDLIQQLRHQKQLHERLQQLRDEMRTKTLHTFAELWDDGTLAGIEVTSAGNAWRVTLNTGESQ